MTNKPRAQRAVEGAPLAGIEHIVVVMFENRSFDNVLGALYPPSDGYWGVSPDLSNTYKKHFWDQSQTVYVTQTPPSGHPPTITPYPDPGESFDDMTAQIFGDPNTGVANMSGFAQNYCDLGLATRDPGDIMFYFKPEQMQVSNLLAGWFAVCDQWFASGPVQTFPNRMFCHCATPSTWRPVGFLEARVNDTDYLSDFTSSGSVTDTSVFQLLDGNSGVPDPANWKVYFHDTPMSVLNAYVNDAFTANSPCLSSFDGSDYDPPHGTTFADDVLNDALPTYAFIEPRYFDNHGGREGLPPNSNHPGGSDYLGVTGPPIDVTNG
ncbi:MAG: alkaline phosphatase family protein, partial [Phenylobacterium sp.]